MPLNRIEQYLGNLRGDGNSIPDKPLNRIEKYLAIICGEDYEIPKPLNRIEQYLADIAENGGGGGGGGSATLITKTINTNGTYDASEDDADGYSEVTVNVPNSYSAGDEGKVVSSGALVSQTAQEYTSNGVYDTTLIDEVTVNVSGGGGGLTLLATDEVTVNTSSTSATDVKTLSVPTAWMADKILMVVVKDKAGLRSGYFYSTMRIISNDSAKRGISTAVNQFAGNIVYETSGGTITAATGNYGVYSKSIASDGTITISARYNSAYGTIDGTYEIKVYAIDIDPFA